MSMNKVIGIDMGGTQIKAGLFDSESGICLGQKTEPTRDGQISEGLPAWAVTVRELVAAFTAEAGADNVPVGISAPGLAARDGSRIDWMPGRMAGLEGFHWQDFLGTETRVMNDAHAALLGEVWQGVAKDVRDVILLTLGTGVGGAVISDGRLLRGHLGRAGHLGHMTVAFQEPQGIVGTPGTLEEAIGNESVARRSGGAHASTRDLLEAVLRHEPAALEVWEKSVQALAAAVASLINCYDPAMMVLGGGISAGAQDLLMDPLHRWLNRYEWRPGGFQVSIKLAALGGWAGCYGAASQFVKRQD